MHWKIFPILSFAWVNFEHILRKKILVLVLVVTEGTFFLISKGCSIWNISFFADEMLDWKFASQNIREQHYVSHTCVNNVYAQLYVDRLQGTAIGSYTFCAQNAWKSIYNHPRTALFSIQTVSFKGWSIIHSHALSALSHQNLRRPE